MCLAFTLDHEAQDDLLGRGVGTLMAAVGPPRGGSITKTNLHVSAASVPKLTAKMRKQFNLWALQAQAYFTAKGYETVMLTKEPTFADVKAANPDV